MKIKHKQPSQSGFAHLLVTVIAAGVIVSIVGIGMLVNARSVSNKTSSVSSKHSTSTTTTSNTLTPSAPVESATNSAQQTSASKPNTGGTTKTSTPTSPTTTPPPSTPAAPTVSIGTPANGATLTMGATPADQYIHYVCTHTEPAGYNGMKVGITGSDGTEYYSSTKPVSDDICNDGFYATDSSDMPNGTYTITITVYDTLGRSATTTSNFQLQW